MPSLGVARYRFPGSQTPTLVAQPQAQQAALESTATLTVLPGAGRSGVSVQWRRNGVNIVDGPAGASVGGGTVSGASGTLASPTTASPISLTITSVKASDAGDYSAVLTNPCGSVTTAAATLTITGPATCTPSDVAGPGQSIGPDGVLTADDIIVFLNRFFAGDLASDVAGPGQSTTPDAQFTADDIIVFLNRFFAGC
jgi:hypothetical protein